MTLWVIVLTLSAAVSPAFPECLSPNVRTVLWRNSELHRRCWSDRDVAVLYARRLFQLILPVRVAPDVNQLLDHFKMCLQVVKNVARTKETHAMLVRPMVDAVGGYLQAFGVPFALEAYYEGNLTYSSAKRAVGMLQTIKTMLSTDGGKWTMPIQVQPSSHIRPYKVVPASLFDNHCSDLISSDDLRGRCKTDKELNWLKAKVPLPFFDDNQSPKAIAVPFRMKTLYSLFDKNSKNILLRYYTAASHCYSTQEDGLSLGQIQFDKEFHKWLIKDVVPLLHDDTWYPAFGGVYSLLALLCTRGLEFPSNGKLVLAGSREQFLGIFPKRRGTAWFFVACIYGFVVMFWVVAYVLFRLRNRKRLMTMSRVNFRDRNSEISDSRDDHEANAGSEMSEAELQTRADQENSDFISDWDSQDILDADTIINYSDKCDAPHGEEILEALIESLLGESSTSQSIKTHTGSNGPPEEKSLTKLKSQNPTKSLSYNIPSFSGTTRDCHDLLTLPFHQPTESV